MQRASVHLSAPSGPTAVASAIWAGSMSGAMPRRRLSPHVASRMWIIGCHAARAKAVNDTVFQKVCLPCCVNEVCLPWGDNNDDDDHHENNNDDDNEVREIQAHDRERRPSVATVASYVRVRDLDDASPTTPDKTPKTPDDADDDDDPLRGTAAAAADTERAFRGHRGRHDDGQRGALRRRARATCAPIREEGSHKERESVEREGP